MLKFCLLSILLFVNLHAGQLELYEHMDMVFFSAFAMMIIYNFGYLVILNSAIYASYFMFHVGLFLIMLFYTGTIEKSWFELNIFHVPVGVFFLSIAMFLVFSREFLDFSVFHPKIESYTNKLIIINLVLVVISAFAFSTHLLETLAITLIILEAIGLLMLSAYLGFVEYNTYARYYFFSFSFLLLGITLVSLKHFNIMSLNINTLMMFEFAILFEAVGLSFALAHKQKESDLTLRQHEVLFKELPHRIQNNLQQIIGILTMQINATEDTNVRKHLEDIISRVGSISLVHKTLQNSSHPGKVNLHTYLKSLISRYQQMHSKVNFIFECDKDIELSIEKVTPLALIINELITNSTKYAFHDKDVLEIVLKIDEDGRINFLYEDNGPGFDENVSTKSIGTQLIKILSKSQLKGKATVDTNNHYRFTLEFSK